MLQVHTYLNTYAAHPRASLPKADLMSLNEAFEAVLDAAHGVCNRTAPDDCSTTQRYGMSDIMHSPRTMGNAVTIVTSAVPVTYSH